MIHWKRDVTLFLNLVFFRGQPVSEKSAIMLPFNIVNTVLYEAMRLVQKFVFRLPCPGGSLKTPWSAVDGAD